MKNTKIVKLMLAVFMTAVIAFAVLTVVACEGKHEHSYGEWTTVTEASCGKKGLKSRVCSSCDESTEGHVEEESIRALVHAYGQWKIAEEATCTQYGVEKRVCNRCDDSVEGHEQTSRINPRGHNWTEKEVAVEPKFNSDGERILFCHCEETKTEPIEKTGVPEAFRGSWVAENCRDITITLYALAIEGLEISSWDGEGNVITAIVMYEDEEVEITLTISEDGQTLTEKDNDNTYTYSRAIAWYNIEVVLSNNDFGEYTLSGEGPYYSGERVVLTIIPTEGYEVSNVTIGGGSIPPEADGTYVIEVKNSDLMVIVQFKVKETQDDSNQAPTYAKEDYVGFWTNYYDRIDYDGHDLEKESYLDVSISGDGLRVVLYDGQEKVLNFVEDDGLFIDEENGYTMSMIVAFNNQPSIALVDSLSGGSGDLYERSSGLDIPDDYYGYWAGPAAAGVYYRICITKTDIYMYSATDLTVTPIMIGVTVNQGAEGGYTFVWEGVTYIVTMSDGEMTLIVNGQTRVSLARGQL